MRKSLSLLVALCILIPACGSLPAIARPHPGESATAVPSHTGTPDAVTARPTLATESLTEIPLHVGHAVRGSWFELYFTDPTNSAAKQITGGPDGPLATAIDSARLTVDAAIYSLSLDSIRAALVRAHRRGVRVRVVMESDNMDGVDPEALKDAGIPVLGDRRQGLMHNKFFVLDRSEVWTGSMNVTNRGAYADNNNMLRIRSTEVANDYETEFNEMFVDDKFGPDVVAATLNPLVIIDGTELEVYFSPDDQVQAALIRALNDAHSSIYFLAYSFTANALGDEIRKSAAAGVKVAGVMEADQVGSNIGSEFDAFRAAGLDVRLDGNPGQMHHKVMIIDGKIVIMGSYNFSSSAETANDENLIVIHDPVIAALYMREFQRVYAMSRP